MPASRIEVPESARQHLPVADYADAFRIPTIDHLPAEDWAREAFEHVHVTDMIAMQGIWRILLGLRLDDLGSSGHVSGWRILEHRDDAVVLGASSWMMDARLVFEVAQHTVTVTTLLRYRRRLAQGVWSAVGGVHRRAVPRILARSRAGLRRGPDAEA